MVNQLTGFFGDRRVKRVLALLLFVAAVVVLRELATLLAFYLIFSRGLGWLAGALSPRTRIPEKAWVGILVATLLAIVGGLVAGEVHTMIPGLIQLREHAQDSVHERVQALRETDLYRTLEAQQVDPEKYSEKIQQFSASIMRGAAETGRVLLHLVLGLILAVLYLLERKEVDEGLSAIPRDTLVGNLIAMFGFLNEAIVLTIKVQLVVALVNALVTLPVLLLLGLSHVPALMLMVFTFGLVPVVGNFISGAVLIVLAYLKRGLLGVVVFVISTFVLHKIESYYLNPRLTAKHVKLPSFALITSLIIWEHLLGLVGVFVSFPALYVAMKVRERFRLQNTEWSGLAPALAVAAAAPAPVGASAVASTPAPADPSPKKAE